MLYYLDTVSIRKLNKLLSDLNSICFTSALSIFELISGISENEFFIRKIALKNLFESHIPIIWELPEAMKTYAFPIVEINESRVLGLKKLCSHLIKSENFETFLSKTKDEKYSPDFFSELDKIYSRGFTEATIRGNENLKRIFANEKKKNGAISEMLAKDFVKSLSTNTELNNSITLNAIADYISKFVKQGGESIEVEELIMCYNGSINTFVEAFSLFTAQKSSLLNTPARNDFIDLHHLLYLGNNPNYFIVTDDKMVLGITKQAISIIEFKNINGK